MIRAARSRVICCRKSGGSPARSAHRLASANRASALACLAASARAALSEALDWPADYLAQVLSGDNARPHADEQRDPVLKSLASIERELRQLRDRVDQIERQLAGEGG